MCAKRCWEIQGDQTKAFALCWQAKRRGDAWAETRTDGCCARARTNAALTVGLRADEAGGGAVKEGEKASHGEADVGVSWPQVQSGEARDLDLQNVLRGHLDVGHLQGHADTHSLCSNYSIISMYEKIMRKI